MKSHQASQIDPFKNTSLERNGKLALPILYSLLHQHTRALFQMSNHLLKTTTFFCRRLLVAPSAGLAGVASLTTLLEEYSRCSIIITTSTHPMPSSTPSSMMAAHSDGWLFYGVYCPTATRTMIGTIVEGSR